MTISSNSLIHFTHNLQSLQGILESNFNVHFCKETVILDEGSTASYIPMVSFCDIPLSQIVEHVGKYGHYGLGLTKDWGLKNGLNPVLYMSSGSRLSIEYRKSFNVAIKKLSTEEQRGLIESRRYIKNYQANLTRKGTTIPNYRFYDEREWRYTPKYQEFKELLVSESNFNAPGKKAEYEEKIKNLKLIFEPNDIKYIIIDNDSEIRGVIHHLRLAKGKFALDDIEKLTTRIITIDQLKADF